jgi:hypothetical protein
MPESIMTLYKRYNDERNRPSFDEISKVWTFIQHASGRRYLGRQGADPSHRVVLMRECKNPGHCSASLAELR